jgi:hypothetical protein
MNSADRLRLLQAVAAWHAADCALASGDAELARRFVERARVLLLSLPGGRGDQAVMKLVAVIQQLDGSSTIATRGAP